MTLLRKAREKGWTGDYVEHSFLHDLQKWLREKHDVHIYIDRESLDSEDMCYVYYVTYLPKEDEHAKHWVCKLKRVCSFHGYGGTYGGGWDRYEQAHEEAIAYSLNLV